MNFSRFVKRFRPVLADPLERAGLRPGLYHYQREADGTQTRFHLRVDPSGAGLLLANATAAAWLAPSGVIIAKGILDGDDDDLIAERLADCFRDVSFEVVAEDIRRVRRLVATLAAPGDNYPIINLADPTFTPQLVPLGKPLSADVPLASPDQLVPLLDRLWDQGIPHVRIVAGAAPRADQLVGAIERAEDLGLIAGVRIRAMDLAEGDLLRRLALAGVDHIDLLYLSVSAAVHDGLAGPGDHSRAAELMDRIVENEVCPVAELGLVDATAETIDETLEALARRGLRNVAAYAVATTEPGPSPALSARELIQTAEIVEAAADRYGLRCLWYPPVRYDPDEGLAAQLRRGPRCSGDHAVRIEPDGRVIPARGPYRVAGNLLAQPWEEIGRSEVFRAYRERIESDTRCDDCPGLALCAADCPRHPAGWADGWQERPGRLQ
ncbi:MAG TPA: hypothetical protein EYP56_15560 [Planctomycetaceae bacterium]|nr:hypothetical protein [Planctomycetaceae bacterium]